MLAWGPWSEPLGGSSPARSSRHKVDVCQNTQTRRKRDTHQGFSTKNIFGLRKYESENMEVSEVQENGRKMEVKAQLVMHDCEYGSWVVATRDVMENYRS